MKNGKKEGTWELWNNDGTKSEEKSYKNGEKDGTWTYWFDNGQKKEELSYKSGKKNGLFTKWDENSKVLEKGTYESNLMVGEWQFLIIDVDSLLLKCFYSNGDGGNQEN